MRQFGRSLVGVVLALVIAGCSESADPPGGSADTTPSPDAVFEDVMDTNADGWRTEFAVEGATAEDAPTLAVLAAQSACTNLETQSVEQVLLTLLSGALPAETAGTLLYAATVAYCPTYTQAVQEYADTNR